jgi:type VI secretion system protein ImpA
MLCGLYFEASLGGNVSNGMVELSPFLEPITGDNPAGSDLREDQSWSNALRQIKDLREAARRAEKQIDLDGGEPKQSLEAWKKLRVLAMQVLQENTKDLEIAACLLEALLRLEGFAGLCDGLRITRGLVENFWDNIYPRPDEDGLETTLLPLQRLDGDVLAGAIRRVPITDGKGSVQLQTWQYRQATDLERCSPEERQTRIDRGAATREMFDQAGRETNAGFFQETYDRLSSCRDEVKLLTEALHERCPEVSPTFIAIDEALTEVQSVVRLVAGPKLQIAPPPSSDAEGEIQGESGDATSVNFVDKAPRGREDAFRILESVAAFFERTEPQSLVPAQLRKVVRWGRMSPAQLYSELIEDSSVREQIFKVVGIAEKPNESSSDSSG